MSGPGHIALATAPFSAVYRLTVLQSVAWHSADAAEREHVRLEIRAAACARRMHGQLAVPIFDCDGRVLERVT